MKIINPLYDNAFKYLMQNEKIAKRVLEVILNQPILELSLSQQEMVLNEKIAKRVLAGILNRSVLERSLRQQEMVLPKEKLHFTIFRLSFKALILDEQGKRQTVLIELQKSRLGGDLIRFRNDLGGNYLQSEYVQDEKGNERRVTYPIITVYILGYNIAEIPHLAVNVNRCIVNAVTNEPLELNSDFINQLTHRSHILQIRRLPQQRRTRLEQFMELFNQSKTAEEPYFLNLDSVSEEFADIARYLHGPVADERFRRQLQVEEEIDLIFGEQEREHARQMEEARQQRKAAEQREQEARRRREAAEQREQEARQQREAAEQREQEAPQREQAMAYKLARQMKRANLPVEEIVAESGLTAEAIGQIT